MQKDNHSVWAGQAVPRGSDSRTQARFLAVRAAENLESLPTLAFLNMGFRDELEREAGPAGSRLCEPD